MKLHYTYEMGATNMIYELEQVMEHGGYNLQFPHCFPTQKEADYFAGYALMYGIAVDTYARGTLPSFHVGDRMTLWATIPELNQ